jgi:hypothetical protein
VVAVSAGFGQPGDGEPVADGVDDHPLAHTGLNRLVVARAGWEDLLHDLAQDAGPDLARLATQHDEITRLQRRADQSSSVRRLPTRTSCTGACS